MFADEFVVLVEDKLLVSIGYAVVFAVVFATVDGISVGVGAVAIVRIICWYC